MPKISCQEYLVAFKEVPQERISAGTEAVEMYMISCQEYVEVVKKCCSGENF